MDDLKQELERFVEYRVAMLTESVRLGDEFDQLDACASLREMGFAAAGAVPVLVEVLSKSHERDIRLSLLIRGMACDALGSIGPEARAALSVLANCATQESHLCDEGRWLKLRAAAAIFKISGDHAILHEVTRNLANDPEEWLRDHADICLKMTAGGEPWPHPMMGRVMFLNELGEEDDSY